MLKRKKPITLRRRDGLLQHSYNKTSQCGEDGILKHVFSNILSPAAEDKDTESEPTKVLSLPLKRWCVEIGSWDGKHLSNSYTLMTEKMWGGILFEADYERYQLLYKLYSTRDDIDTQCCLVDCSSDKKNSLVELFKSSKSSIELPHDFDFLSIDIDGADYHLWNSLK